MIGVLYESNEWSDHKLATELVRCGVDARLINMEDPTSEEVALTCEMLVSRVFASAQFRGHTASLARMPRIIVAAEQRDIPLLNPGRAHFFEIDKCLAAETLAQAGLITPAIYACDIPAKLDPATLTYPCVIKPNCSGRTTYTIIAHDAAEAQAFLAQAPAIPFIAQEYIEPAHNFITRIEVVDGTCALVMKRSIADNGLSAYRFGSTYEHYDDCPRAVTDVALRAAATLSIELGSFDIIESERGSCIIDANSVSNVSPDCTELFGLDLMKMHAQAITQHYRTRFDTPQTKGSPHDEHRGHLQPL